MLFQFLLFEISVFYQSAFWIGVLVGLTFGILTCLSFTKKQKESAIEPDKEHLKEWFDLRLQAYERMILFLERISPSVLLRRVPKESKSVIDYRLYLLNSVQNEYEHNITQQMYLSETLWNHIVENKHSIDRWITSIQQNSSISNIDHFRKLLIKHSTDVNISNKETISLIKIELKKSIRHLKLSS